MVGESVYHIQVAWSGMKEHSSFEVGG